MKLLYNPFNYEVERNRGILLAKRADRTPRDEVRRQQVRSINCSFRLKQIADRVRLFFFSNLRQIYCTAILIIYPTLIYHASKKKRKKRTNVTN